jgi:hypothetical protein
VSKNIQGNWEITLYIFHETDCQTGISPYIIYTYHKGEDLGRLLICGRRSQNESLCIFEERWTAFQELPAFIKQRRLSASNNFLWRHQPYFPLIILSKLTIENFASEQGTKLYRECIFKEFTIWLHRDVLYRFPMRLLFFFNLPNPSRGSRGSVVVKTLCYKPEGRGFDTRWGGFLKIYLIFPAALSTGVYSASNRNEYRKH